MGRDLELNTSALQMSSERGERERERGSQKPQPEQAWHVLPIWAEKELANSLQTSCSLTFYHLEQLTTASPTTTAAGGRVTQVVFCA